jgi:hypothetical protein
MGPRGKLELVLGKGKEKRNILNPCSRCKKDFLSISRNSYYINILNYMRRRRVTSLSYDY